MASVIVGRADCPECGFKAAHVKRSEKCLYRYCPECGSQHHARTERQVSDLMKKTRLVEPTASQGMLDGPVISGPTPTPSPTEPIQATDTPTHTPTPTKRRGLFA